MILPKSFKIAWPLALAAVTAALFFSHRDAATPARPQATVKNTAATGAAAATEPAPVLETTPARPSTVIPLPLPVALEKGTHRWTSADFSSVQVIEKIAHNPDEVIRMVEENERIKRRQLVYRGETAAAIVQRSRATGEPIRSLTLPGLDGQEIQVEVTGSDLAFSGLSGTFTGRVAGKEQSIVTLAFKNNREAFSVASPEDKLFLEAEPREPGQVIVKEIDPDTYASGHCGSDEYGREQGKPGDKQDKEPEQKQSR